MTKSLMAAHSAPSLKLGHIRTWKICHCTYLHNSAGAGLQCAVLMQFCADTCMQLLHRTSRSKICVVIGMQGSMQSLCIKDPYSSQQLEILIELGCADLYRYTKLCDCAARNLVGLYKCGNLQISWLFAHQDLYICRFVWNRNSLCLCRRLDV